MIEYLFEQPKTDDATQFTLYARGLNSLAPHGASHAVSQPAKILRACSKGMAEKGESDFSLAEDHR
ncbi:protein of unknown function [Hyphomicrobium sp. 1Nfss2.1]